MVVGSDDGKVYAWHHDGTPVAGWPQTTGDMVYGSPALGDLDGDGHLEVVVGCAGLQGLRLARQRHTGGRLAADHGRLDQQPPALGDLDGDGDLEVVVGS